MRNTKHIVKVGDHSIGAGYPVFIIAEIGTSHGGSVDLAVKLIERAASCGVTAVKLQTVKVEESYTPGEDSYEIFRDLWFDPEDLEKLMRVAEANRILLFSTAGDLFSLGMMMEVGMPLIKISSGLITNHPLIGRAAEYGRPILISTGMSYLDEAGAALRVAEEKGCRDLMLLQCTSLYPTPPEKLNLNAMRTMDAAFPYPVGLSDHTRGTTAAVAAVALGAALLEKHFILDRAIPGPDTPFASEPGEMKSLVEEVRGVEKMLGSPVKEPTEEEMSRRDIYRRCLMARKGLKAGQVLEVDLITIKRPRAGERGLPPYFLEYVRGLRVSRDIAENEPITLNHLCT